MNNLCLIVGEDSDIPKDILSKNNIIVFPFTVTWDKGNYSKDELFDVIRSNQKNNISNFPKTSQPSTGYFKKLFLEKFKNNSNIILISVSSKLSGTYNAALQARDMLSPKDMKKIFILDSKHISASEALLTLQAANLIQSHKSAEDIIKTLKDQIPSIHLLATINDPGCLEAGGRISRVKSAVIKQLIKIGVRPILTLKDGSAELLKIKGNAHEKSDALFSQFTTMLDDTDSAKKIDVAICHGDNIDEAKKLEKKLLNYSKKINIVFTNKSSAVFGAHLGPDSLVMAWKVQD
ncbi:MAG TPA: DegV family protein [Candidatus Nitrosocosmicus sp.]|nr:DegV family protein [Candidatus Nitrosocosmicus sp.]